MAPIDKEPPYSENLERIVEKLIRPPTFSSAAPPRSGTFVGSVISRAGTVLQNRMSSLRTPLESEKSMQTTAWQLIKESFTRLRSPRSGSHASLAPEPNERQMQEALMVLNMFNFSELQALHNIGEKLEEVLCVVKLDALVLREVRECYENWMGNESMPETLRNAARPAMADFSRRVKRVEQNLLIRQTQLTAMIAQSRDGKTLASILRSVNHLTLALISRQFDAILQYRSVQVSRIFAHSAHESAAKMEKLAQKTEHGTASMHVITAVTLFFLPGTFIAVCVCLVMLWKGFLLPLAQSFADSLAARRQTFFQSGIFQWQPRPDDAEEAWWFNLHGFYLFLAICLPVMAVTGLLWWSCYKYLKRRSRQSLEESEV